MRKLETWLAALMTVTALLLPIAALDQGEAANVRTALSGWAAGACDDGSAHLATGCASIFL